MVKENTLVSWEAQEYVQRSKNTGWYIGLIVVGILFAALSVFLQWWTFLALIIVSVVALIVYSVRPPRTIKYELTNKGIISDGKLREYSSFKAFGVANEDNHFSIVLIPKKRFSPRFTLYFPKEQGEKIVDIFGARLPMQEVKPDVLDRLVKFLRI